MLGFLKQYRSFILFHLFSIGLILVIVTLDLLNHDLSISSGSLAYIILLSLILLMVFLTFSYIRERQNYQAMKETVTHISQPINSLQDTSFLFEQFNRIIKKQYTYYIKEITQVNDEKHRYYTFINQWVHQMKTPLSVISLLLQNENQKQSSHEPFIHSIEEETEKLQKGLELVLHSSRLDLFQEDFKVERMSLIEVVRACIQEHKSSFIRHKVFPSMKMNNDYTVESDRKWLAFIINQLISNSIKYTSGFGKQVVFTVEGKGTSVTLRIQDDGIGIPRQDLNRVFQPFFTGQNGRKHPESTGMGLYLAQRTCEEIGHTITIDSTENQGTTIEINFFNVTTL